MGALGIHTRMYRDVGWFVPGIQCGKGTKPAHG